jgi:Spy/CpxP family protein refolding chaperone
VAHAYDRGKAKKSHSKSDKGLKEKFFHKAHFMLKNKKKLGLSTEQVKKIKDLKIKTKKDLIKRKASIDIIAIDVKVQLWEDVINAKAVNSLIDKKYELKKAKAKSLVGAYVALKNVLTEEQKEDLKALLGKCKTGKR